MAKAKRREQKNGTVIEAAERFRANRKRNPAGAEDTGGRLVLIPSRADAEHTEYAIILFQKPYPRDGQLVIPYTILKVASEKEIQKLVRLAARYGWQPSIHEPGSPAGPVIVRHDPGRPGRMLSGALALLGEKRCQTLAEFEPVFEHYPDPTVSRT
jgi:hypothetical protein